MRRPSQQMLRRLTSAVLGVTAAVFFFAVAVPHYHHDGASAAHPGNTCRVCKIQDGFSAAPPATPGAAVQPALFHIAHVFLAGAPRAGVLIASLSPRAPPALS